MNQLQMLKIIAFEFILLSLLITTTAFADRSNEAAAIGAAVQFLQLVDAERYGESWEVTSDFFKKNVPKPQWEQQIGSLRPAFGQLITREPKKLQHATSLPGAPDGEYVVIQFSTTFENKQNAIETVTPMLESDGEWRITGYYIR